MRAEHAAARTLDDLYRSHAGEVYRYAFAVLGQHADAEDVTQTTFLNAYRSLENGVRPRRPSSWLLTIASNLIKQRFRTERARPASILLDEQLADAEADGDAPTIGELLTALGKIPPLQRQAIVLREFEGRSYREIAGILEVSTSALETLLFRARKSLAEELASSLTCAEAQLALSRASDGRIGRKERRRLREHLTECPDCTRFARAQPRTRRAFRGLALLPVPFSDWVLRAVETPAAAAATLPAAAGTATAGSGGLASIFGASVAIKAAAVVAAASVVGGVGVVGATGPEPVDARRAPRSSEAPPRLVGPISTHRVFAGGAAQTMKTDRTVGDARAVELAAGDPKQHGTTSVAPTRSGRENAPTHWPGVPEAPASDGEDTPPGGDPAAGPTGQGESGPVPPAADPPATAPPGTADPASPPERAEPPAQGVGNAPAEAGSTLVPGQGNGRGNAYGHVNDNGDANGHASGQGNGNAYGHGNDNGQGNANAYGHEKDNGQGNANAYGHEKDNGQGNGNPNGHAEEEPAAASPATTSEGGAGDGNGNGNANGAGNGNPDPPGGGKKAGAT